MYKTLHKKQGSVTVQLRFARSSVTFCAKRDNRIAAHIGVSPSYFSSIFKQETGTTFVEYLTKVRIDKACELLRCTNSRTAEIGEQVGYSDPHYFSATFKKVMGQSPKDYRAGQKG